MSMLRAPRVMRGRSTSQRIFHAGEALKTRAEFLACMRCRIVPRFYRAVCPNNHRYCSTCYRSRCDQCLEPTTREEARALQSHLDEFHGDLDDFNKDKYVCLMCEEFYFSEHDLSSGVARSHATGYHRMTKLTILGVRTWAPYQVLKN